MPCINFCYERYLTNTKEEEDIPKLVNIFCRGDGRDGTIEGFIKLNEEDCTKIYKMMV
ncbi:MULTISPECIES: iron-containing alcohol dehydrogenase [Pseudobutyrivibrio]|uniref:Iron-containing alcohol dehydrogenase n=1 Tax=Pseudobutyrivibrio xylanivorans TaxID=185007 RepID=A0A6M0LFV5_PSEXY|nr:MULTISPECIES: iron-containing alcohol dehydrogenase [Pseudobutyrivibrio]NEX01472.1 iron-containing alcohol dehydrogenase [Pseudobutyrivibrio xylanivorans]